MAITEANSENRKETRTGVYETLFLQHMLAPNDNLEMIALDEAHTGKGT